MDDLTIKRKDPEKNKPKPDTQLHVYKREIFVEHSNNPHPNLEAVKQEILNALQNNKVTLESVSGNRHKPGENVYDLNTCNYLRLKSNKITYSFYLTHPSPLEKFLKSIGITKGPLNGQKLIKLLDKHNKDGKECLKKLIEERSFLLY